MKGKEDLLKGEGSEEVNQNQTEVSAGKEKSTKSNEN